MWRLGIPFIEPPFVWIPDRDGDAGIPKPGCTAADEAVTALGHLQGLARGNGSFGVLQHSKSRLETAAEAAAHLGQGDLASQMRNIANEMPAVRDQAAAEALAGRLLPVVDQAWGLGSTCKGSLTPASQDRVEFLARRVRAGELTKEQAIEELKK